MSANATRDCSLIAILRGLTPSRAEAVGRALFEAGVRAIEVPLNSPEPFRSIEILRATLPHSCMVGAGTVVNADDIARVRDAGGHLVVTPNSDAGVVARGVALKMMVIAGFATPSEAVTAIKAGADRLKLFPASHFGPAYLRALKDVLPPHVCVHAVGGVGPAEMQAWVAAGIDGFGLGAALFRPDDTIADITARAIESVDAVRRAFAKQNTTPKDALDRGDS